MRAFYNEYSKVAQPVRQFVNSTFFDLSWWHDITRITRSRDNHLIVQALLAQLFQIEILYRAHVKVAQAARQFAKNLSIAALCIERFSQPKISNIKAHYLAHGKVSQTVRQFETTLPIFYIQLHCFYNNRPTKGLSCKTLPQGFKQEDAKLPALLAQLPWRHHLPILNKKKNETKVPQLVGQFNKTGRIL